MDGKSIRSCTEEAVWFERSRKKKEKMVRKGKITERNQRQMRDDYRRKQGEEDDEMTDEERADKRGRKERRNRRRKRSRMRRNPIRKNKNNKTGGVAVKGGN